MSAHFDQTHFGSRTTTDDRLGRSSGAALRLPASHSWPPKQQCQGDAPGIFRGVFGFSGHAAATKAAGRGFGLAAKSVRSLDPVWGSESEFGV